MLNPSKDVLIPSKDVLIPSKDVLIPMSVLPKVQMYEDDICRQMQSTNKMSAFRTADESLILIGCLAKL